MRLRKFLIAGAAVAAATALAVIPSAEATNPSGGTAGSVHVGSNTTGSHAISMALTSASVTMDLYGSPVNLGCTAGSAAGSVNASSPAPSPFMSFTSLGLTCDSFYPGSTVTVSVPSNGCANITLDPADSNIHDGLLDDGVKGGKFDPVDGFLNLPAGCNVTVNQSPCTYTLGGSTPVNFGEILKPNGSQTLTLKGSGLLVRSASFLCLGAMSVNDPVTLNSVVFDVNSTDGSIDVRETP